LGSFRQSQRAAALAGRVREAGHAATIEMAEVGGTAWHRVMLDGFADRTEAGRVGEELRTRLGIDYLIRRRD
jgi:cell division septation protein DedD